MSEMRLSDRNKEIQAMLADGERLKDFYRFSAQNPHINLHDACQIVIARPNASVCFSFEEWNAMERRVTKNRKGIPYYDSDGYKRFVFDVNDTHGQARYQRLIYPMKRLLVGLDELNGTSIADDERGDYRKIHIGVAKYLQENNYLTDDKERNRLFIDGATYALYCKTGFPKNTGIRLSGLPYSLQENAVLFKEVYVTSALMQQEIEEAYLRKQDEVKVIEDIDERTVSDEPVITQSEQDEVNAAEHADKEWEKSPSPLYKLYMTAQEKYPDAIAFMRVGDFYEVMGENAKTVADELDLTLTSRDVGLDERVPMCGFPYHVADKYCEKLLKKHSLVIMEDGEEKYILSHAEAFEQEAEAKAEEHSETEEDFDEFDEPDFDDDEMEVEIQEEEQPQATNTAKPPKSIRERKRKELTLFDLMDGKEKTPEEQFIAERLCVGSHVEGGKFRIYKKYHEDPSVKEFADFLKNEYGIGGASTSTYDEMYDGKGIRMKNIDTEHPENEIAVSLKWTEVANYIADLIDDGEYLTAQEKQAYDRYVSGADYEEPIQDIAESGEPQATQQEEQVENTDLNAIDFDQSELGGAKARFKGNIEAIRLVKRLYAENRSPSDEEKRVLAKYVGFGGLAQAFDERNQEWQKEYAELKELLTAEEYEKAKGSVLNAHYTSKEVIAGMYQALQRFGVKGNNRILEPAMGTGNFFGFMPKEMASGAKLHGVELDSLTGRIASKLYPQVKVQIKGYEETTYPNNHFDVVVGNVPFGGYTVYDSEYNRHNFLIHDYFIAKSIDKLKPKGVMAVITSKGTMDKLSPTVRKYIADRAELLGAIRLPNTAFKQTAHTEVVTDILFFQKRDEPINADTQNTEWLSTEKTEEGFEINSYFVRHPEMVLGTMVKEHGLYGAEDMTVKSDGRDLSEALGAAVGLLPENIYENPAPYEEEEQDELEADYDVKPLCYKAENGRLYLRVGDKMVEQTVPSSPKDAYSRIKEMIGLRNALKNILDLQIAGCSDAVLEQEQRKLNVQYDLFVKKYGYVNSQTNTRLFKEDGDSALLFACETLSEDKKSATKADIFHKRTIRPYMAVTSTDDAFEALQISKNERGTVDIAYIEELTKKDYDTVLSELGDSVFRNPLEIVPDDKYSGFESAEEYLSGNVVRKLAIAKSYAEQNAMFAQNVKALEQVQPTPLTASEISVRIGASWVDKTYYQQFLKELLQIPSYYAYGLELYYNPHDSSWRVDRATNALKGYRSQRIESLGTERASVYRLFEDCLNLRATTIYDTVEEDGREKRVLNQAETIAAREKQNQIKEWFKEWIFHDPVRREELETRYNALFNQIRLPNYDGSYLKFPEMNPAIELKPHQRDAVHRIITSGNTLLHHVVGAGKTFTICAAAMKLRQYGIAKKPMIAVPNHLVQQWAGEFRQLYPNAKLLIASKEDLEKDNRQKFVSKVAMGDWDAVIIAQSSFAKIPISPERQIRKLRDEIERIEDSIQAQWEESNAPRGAVKNLERIKKNREATLKKLLDDDKKDHVLLFEKLGVDYLFIDEAHYYKNLFLFTKMNNVAGISSSASQRASDLQLKCEYISELHGGDKGIVFATGTPISNSMTEMYTMQTYLQPRTLQELGITYFDGWAADFGETITSLEMAPSGQGYKAKTRFAKFTNLPELLTLYRSFADVKTSDMVKLNVPEAERNVINLKPSDTVIELAEEIADRAERINAGGIDPHEDNMLKVTSDGKKLALDARCFDPMAEDSAGSKLNECAARIFEIWQDTAENKGTQIVFCDLSTPKKAFEDYEYGKDFDVYNDLKYKLVAMGIPKEEIAFIHEANSDLQKQTLFDNVNAGNVRVLIGSTEKCGAGTNVQKRLVALHHLDTPYRPSDMQQREGRIIRQGNGNEKVQIFTYVTERTFDSYSYQILENKQRFISQIDRGDLTVREADDIDEATLSYAEIKAITAANPKIKRKMELDTEVARLRVLEGQYKKNLYAIQDKVRKEFPEKIRRQELYIERLREDTAHLKEAYNPEVFQISVGGTIYTDKKEGARALTDTLYASKPDTVVAEYGGFKISMNPLVLLTAERSITLTGAGQYVLDIGSSASGNITRLDNFLADFPNKEARAVARLEQLHKDLEVAKEQAEQPFEHKNRLEELTKELIQINAELDLNRREEVVIGDEKDEAQYMGLPDIKKEKEVNFIEEIDKFVEMQVDFPADYFTTQAEMHKAGYLWDGMLPMKQATAQRLYENGLQIYLLNADDTESAATSSQDIQNHNGLFGVEKPDWKAYLEQPDAQAYFFARLAMCQAASEGVRSEMDYMDERFIIGFVEANDEERSALEGYLNYKKVPEAEAMKPYLGELLDEFTNRIGGWHLEHYGWTYDDVTKMLADKIKPEALNCYAQLAIVEKGIHNTGLQIFISDQVRMLNGDKYDLTSEQVGQILPSLKASIKASKWNGCEAGQSYDDWFGNFAATVLPDYLYMKEGETPEISPTPDRISVDKARENRIPVYLQTLKYAREHGEIEEYRASCKLSEECKSAIEQAVRENFDGMHLNAGFEEQLIDEYGYERVAHICASTLVESEWDGRYSRENKAWARTIPVSKNEDERSRLHLNTHPAVLDGVVSRIRKKQKETEKESDIMAQPQYATETKKGYKILSITKDNLGRDIAIFQRENDYVVAAGYNSEDGTWAQGYYDFATLEAAEDYRKERYGESAKPKRNWLKVNVAKDALIRAYDRHSFFRMPATNEAYAGFTYNIFNSRIKESRQLADLESDSRELCYELLIAEDEEIVLKKKEEEKVLTGKEFASLVSGSLSKDYEYRKEDSDKEWITVSVPQEAMRGMYENASLFTLPKFTEAAGYSFYIPNAFLEEDKESEDGSRIVMRLPEDFKITAKDRKTGDEIQLSAYQLYKRMDNTIDSDYLRERAATQNETATGSSAWQHIDLTEKAKIMEYEARTLFKMPNGGKYEGFAYYIPNGLLKYDEENGQIQVSLPEDFEVKLKDNKSGETLVLTPEELTEALKGKTEEDYASAYFKPSEGNADKFSAREQTLIESVPDEMKAKPNWVIVRTRMNEEKGRLDKFLISPVTGKFAESDNPETWTDFETACKYAHENGGETLAFALDGKDGICCIDLDHCKDKDGKYTPLASEVLQKCGKTYIEESVSGTGLHIFGKTDGMDLRTFSRDGDLEFYQKAHFIAMTGDGAGYAELASFDTQDMKSLLERKCDKRRELKGAGQGVEGLSSMSDRDVVEKACASKHGDTFKALYEGRDLQNNHSNSDMSLMNRLAFWCNGDKEQMLRIFATSGLYRENKSANYYEGTAIKAVRDTTSRFQPSEKSPQSPAIKNAGTFGKA